MADLKPWLEVAEPRRDIADGSFDESLFAADLGLVDRGRGPLDYRDPVMFCEKTYLTGSLLAFLKELTARLSGDMTAAGVYRLQTEFGGGKTHTLLTAYHLFRDPAKVAATAFAQELAAKLGRSALPQAKVVVLEGAALRAGDPDPEIEDAQVHTLLGQLAYRLGGAAEFAKVADQDRELRGSSTTQIVKLLEAHAPCLILVDELLQYLTKALVVRTHDGNLAATTLTFVKELCTAVAAVPEVAVVATLTSSNLEDYSSVTGEDMQQRLSKVVGRTENIITPVEGDDIFPILHRRLFTTIGPEQHRRAVADAYANWYESLGDAVPASYREASYRDRLATAFPFHPELVDILTNRWGSLSGFQRTRGALRTLAHTVKALAQRHQKSLLIHPGDVVLADPGIRAEVIRFAGESYKAALNADIIRPDSIAPSEDRRRGGQVESAGLATGLATTAFLDSFGPDRVLGASAAQMLLGVGRPGLSRGLIEDVRDALEASLWYMRLEGGRYRFTTEPNLNKVILERESAVTDDRIETLLREAISTVAPSAGELRVEPRVAGSADLPDNQQLVLGVLDFGLRVGAEASEATLRTAREILERRGGSWRANKNAAMLVAADAPAIAKARASARTLAALRDLTNDRHRLNRFNAEQREQLGKRLSAAGERLPQQVTMAYRHLLLLGQGNGGGAKLDHIDLGPARADATISGRVLEYLRTTDRLIDTTLAPAALLAARFGLLPEGTDAVELDTLLSYFYRLPRLPKLANPQVLRHSLTEGVHQGLFGLASGSAWDADDSVLRFADVIDPSEIQFQPGTWLVRASVIKTMVAARQPAAPPGPPEDGVPEPPPQPGGPEPQPPTATGGTSPTPPPATTLPAVTVRVHGVPASKVRDVVKVAVLPLSAASAEVTVDLVIHADGGMTGIPRETLNLVVLEGLRQLGLLDAQTEFPERR
ncbi:MAG TPA: DUF499 domain-containing protein [Streptosporangiaceae bacterium]|nr:DUF499 domain-containing protein [Streptosporangiaceae bacterium]